MSQDIAIRAEDLGKRYVLGEQPNVFTFTEHLSQLFSSSNPLPAASQEAFWALRHIDFELPKGSITGIVGKNGAGKSTLLKILSRITPPTEGRFFYNGTVASLLEVGSGFKQELTGRDNIFLSGTILGLRRHQIQAKFDDIVEFAEIESFIDTPVKRYSSGMFVRLAFAVAAHLEPDILLVDEVLAVGDIKFQKKCLQRMGEDMQDGRTIVFVSHNMQAMSQLCRTGLLLDKGEMLANGDMAKVISQYQQFCRQSQLGGGTFTFELEKEREAAFHQIKILHGDQPQLHFDILDSLGFEVEFDVHQDLDDLKVVLHVNTLDGQTLYSSTHLDWNNFVNNTKERMHAFKKGRYTVCGKLPSPLLNTGYYDLGFHLSTTHIKVHHSFGGIEVEITDDNMSFASCINMNPSTHPIVPPVQWDEVQCLS